MRVFANHPARSLMLGEIADESQIPEDRLEDLLSELKNDGLCIDSQDIYGVIYEPQETRLHPDVIAARLTTQWWGKRVLVGDELSSTIDIAKGLEDDQNLHGAVIIANLQTHGRGRFGNHWISRKGKDVLLTFVVRYTGWQPSPSLVSLYAAISAARVLDTAYQLPVTIKWPNDLFLHNHKVGGILVEKDESRSCFYISMGLNVNSRYSDWPEELRNTATSLSMEKSIDWQRNLLIAQCGNTWEFLWDLMLQDQGETIRNYWKRYTNTMNRKVSFQYQSNELTGIVRNLNTEGLLILEDAAGNSFELLPELVRHLRITD